MQPNTYWADKLQRGECERTVLLYKSASGTITQHEGASSLASSAAVTDAAVYGFLRLTASPFAAAAFDATALGNDAFCAIIDFQGQIRELVAVEAEYVGEAIATSIAGVHLMIPSGTLTASTLESKAEKSAEGNLGVKCDFGNVPDFDGTTGWIKLTVHWRSK